MEPLKAGALDPLGTILDASGMKVEGRANAEHQQSVQLGKKSVHEHFLAGRTDADPDHVRLQNANR